jgi:hypothetical protein
MARFTLLVRPDGKAVLTTPERLSDAAKLELRDAVRGWSEGRWPVLIVQDCAVVQVAEFDLDLERAEVPA